jgi:hypothetical protein
MEPTDKKYLILECGTKAYPGEVVYNYYDMRPVMLGEISDYEWERADDPKKDIWVNCRIWAVGESRGTDLMNGERLCSIEFAKRRDFRDAEKVG